MKSVDQRDLVGGLLVAVVGGAFAVAATGLPKAEPGMVGPAYVPMATGIIAIILGLIISGKAFLGARPIPRINIRPVLAIFAATAVFALLIRNVGFVPTIFAVVAVAASGSPKSRPLPVLYIAGTVSLACWLIFIVGLGLPIDVVRSPF
ncbi:tripartite tricarboxylate transporter TctB family protein [Roseibium marinum]|uniref:Tripartite tricarboxylate transporter TctB family protein n=1 Tax=Roseibium marinum TaxID=281252 RepID=A0A2S3UK09_9HYPH|nr:tripartite tricarboxylate transporter TctB family protein [Roseibium marinum]POF27913.1 tripartite tricarboxylate transporter TctB family protein [Roseibium marinum]